MDTTIKAVLAIAVSIAWFGTLWKLSSSNSSAAKRARHAVVIGFRMGIIGVLTAFLGLIVDVFLLPFTLPNILAGEWLPIWPIAGLAGAALAGAWQLSIYRRESRDIS